MIIFQSTENNLNTIKDKLIALIKEKFKAEHLLMIGFNNIQVPFDCSYSEKFLEISTLDKLDLEHFEASYDSFEVMVENNVLKVAYHNSENGKKHVKEIHLLKKEIKSEKTATKLLSAYTVENNSESFLNNTLKSRAYKNFGKAVSEIF